MRIVNERRTLKPLTCLTPACELSHEAAPRTTRRLHRRAICQPPPGNGSTAWTGRPTNRGVDGERSEPLHPPKVGSQDFTAGRAACRPSDGPSTRSQTTQPPLPAQREANQKRDRFPRLISKCAVSTGVNSRRSETKLIDSQQLDSLRRADSQRKDGP